MEINNFKNINKIKLFVKGYRTFGGDEIVIDFQSRKLKWKGPESGDEGYYEKTIRQNTFDKFVVDLEMLDILNWKDEYIDLNILDGTHWSLEIIISGISIYKYGDNKFPDNWDKFCKLIRKISGKNFS